MREHRVQHLRAEVLPHVDEVARGISQGEVAEVDDAGEPLPLREGVESGRLEVGEFEVEGTRWSYVFYQSGLSINVLYAVEDGGKRAVVLIHREHLC